MGVGRRRKDGNPQRLERRVYWHHGQYRYRHRTGRWEDLGTDVDVANARGKALNNPGTAGTISYYLAYFLSEARAGRLPAGWTLSPRSIADYAKEAELFKESPLGKMYPPDLVREPNAIAEYRDHRVVDGKGEVQANHALSLLSSMYTWLIEKGHCRGLIVNPVKLITRFSRDPKDRYVEDHEYQPVYGIAQRSVCMAMLLTYRTLQRPGDLLALPPSAVRAKAVAGAVQRVLTVKQSKTGRTVDIEVTTELEQALMMLSPDGVLGSMPLTADGKVRKPLPTLIHTTAGKPYTEDGLGAMLRRYCYKAAAAAAKEGVTIKTFGLMDVRAKGATDMYLAGTPLETIQLLMGHESVQTTEIYIKRLLRTVRVAQPNSIAISA